MKQQQNRKRRLKVMVVATEGSEKREDPHFMRVVWGNGLKATHAQQYANYWKAHRAAEDFIEALGVGQPVLDESEAAPALRRSRETSVSEDSSVDLELGSDAEAVNAIRDASYGMHDHEGVRVDPLPGLPEAHQLLRGLIHLGWRLVPQDQPVPPVDATAGTPIYDAMRSQG